MRKIVLLLGIFVFILGGLAYFYYYDNTVSVNHFSNGNISFDYHRSFALEKSPVGDENSKGYFVCALISPSRKSAIILYQIPRFVKTNVTPNETVNSTSNTTIYTSAAFRDNSSNNTTEKINTTVEVNVDNLQVYLDLVSIRNGYPIQLFKNNYTYYESGNLKSPLATYKNSSRTNNLTIVFINETAIVKDGHSNFYVVELLSCERADDAERVYKQIVNTLRIIGS